MKQHNSFVLTFQTDNSLTAFLAKALEDVLRGILERFVRREALGETSSVYSLAKTDSQKPSSLRNGDKVDVSFTVKSEIIINNVTDN